MGGALDELSMLSSTIVGATIAFSKQPVPESFKSTLSEFLSAALDQMAACVSLINGRLPLDSSDEALQEVARCALPQPLLHGERQRSSPGRNAAACSVEQPREMVGISSTAFFHSLSVCGYMLCIVKEVADDVCSRHSDPATPPPPRSKAEDEEDNDLMLDSDTHVLIDVVPKVQATGCRCGPVTVQATHSPWTAGACADNTAVACRLVMLIGSLVKSASPMHSLESRCSTTYHGAATSISSINGSPRSTSNRSQPLHALVLDLSLIHI